MKSSLSLYLPKESWVHRLNPVTKLILMLCFVVMGFSVKNYWLPWGLAITLLGISGSGKIFRPLLSKLITIVLPFITFLFFIHGFFSPKGETILVQWGAVTLFKEGVFFAVLMSGRITSAVAASLIFVFCTSPDDLTISLRQKGVPTGLVYLLGATLQIIPLMKKRADSISAAQQTRGVETSGTLKNRIKAFFPLVQPLILSSLVDVEERAIALEARCFWVKGDKTSLREIKDPQIEKVIRWAMGILTLVVLITSNLF